ncbi:MAG: transposase [Stenomitos frigidus ULC029]
MAYSSKCLNPCCLSYYRRRKLLPQKKRTRSCGRTKQEIINGILYQLKNGCNWADLSNAFPPYSTVYWHYKQWRAAGTIEILMGSLHEQVRS